MALEHVVALAGGVGGAKLALGLLRALRPEQLTVIVNTADDFVYYGLPISPDLDTVMYTLAGIANPETGWGVAADTTHMLDMLARYGEAPWFRLGDHDLATHLLRAAWLAQGQTLTQVTRRLAEALGVQSALLPMTDAPVHTIVYTREQGRLEFQEYFVRYRWQPVVERIEYAGAESALPTPAVLAALAAADIVVICPSNPLLSVAPILALSGVRAALRQKPCVAVSPIVAGQALKGPAAKLMAELGWDVSPLAVARYYGDLLDGFVLDVRDRDGFSDQDFPCRVLVTDTVMQNDGDKLRLAREILRWTEESLC